MAREAGRSFWSRQTVAVILLLCCLAQSLTCFSLRGLSRKAEQDKIVRRGNVHFSGTELDSESGSASAAATEIAEQKDVRATEAAWRRLNPTLHCGQTKMTLKAMGPEAADLQLDMGNARPRPLSQVPETCGYSVQQNILGLILVVPYDGCNVIQENGNYVVPLRWQETPVKLTCPMLPSPDATPAPTTPKSSQHPWKLPSPHRPWSLSRQKRQATQPFYNYSPYLYYYYYYMYMMRQALTTASPTTTTKPDTTNITEPTTVKPPPAYPYYMYHPYYYYPYYPYYPLSNQVRPTVPPATTSEMTSAPTTKAPQKPPFYHPYYPHYNQPGQQLPENPDNPEIYYYPIIQHFYGKPPYPGSPSQPTIQPTTPTTKPSDSSPTTEPTTASDPTTASSPTTTITTTKPCKTTPSSSNNYPGQMSPFVSYHDQPYNVSFIRSGRLPDYQKYRPQDGYKSGLQARAHPQPGFHYWQPAPWFPHATGKGIPHFNFKNLQPKQA